VIRVLWVACDVLGHELWMNGIMTPQAVVKTAFLKCGLVHRRRARLCGMAALTVV
jgi:hypothetical protein